LRHEENTITMKVTAVLVILSLSLVLSYAANDTYSWTPIDWRSLPVAKADDQVQVYYLAAPLLKANYGSILGVFGLYHGALGFFNKNNNMSFTMNYDADDFFRSNLFPEVVVYPNGTKDLKWDNQGALYIYSGIWTEYFSASNALVTTINGNLYNQFMNSYVDKVNSTHKYYNMVNVKDHNTGSILIDGWDCFDFCWEAFGWFEKNGASLSNEALPRDSINLYSNSIDRVEDTPIVKPDIVDFYEFTQAAFKKMTLIEILTEVWTLYQGNFYVRVDDAYYRLSLQWPPASVHLDHTTPSKKTVSSRLLSNPNPKPIVLSS